MEMDRKHVLDQFFRVCIGLFQFFSAQNHISDEFSMILEGFWGFLEGFGRILARNQWKSIENQWKSMEIQWKSMEIDGKHVLDQFFDVCIGLFRFFSAQNHIYDEF